MNAELNLAEKYLKIASLQADTALNEMQNRFEPWKLVVSAMAAGGVLGGAIVGWFAAVLHVAR